MLVSTSLKPKENLTMSKDILYTEMKSGSAFGETKKVTRTELVEIFKEAKETVFTVNFCTKVDDKHIKEVL